MAIHSIKVQAESALVYAVSEQLLADESVYVDVDHQYDDTAGHWSTTLSLAMILPDDLVVDARVVHDKATVITKDLADRLATQGLTALRVQAIRPHQTDSESR